MIGPLAQQDPLWRTPAEIREPGNKEMAIWVDERLGFVPLAWAPYAVIRAAKAGQAVRGVIYGTADRQWVVRTIRASGLVHFRGT